MVVSSATNVVDASTRLARELDGKAVSACATARSKNVLRHGVAQAQPIEILNIAM